MQKGKKENRWVSLIIVGVIILAIFLAKFPTIYNALNTPKPLWFPKQTSWFDAWDINFQVSYIRFGQRMGMLLQNTYTTYPHQGVFVYQYYTILGVINRLVGLDPFLLFHLSSIFTSIAIILIYWRVVKLFLQDTHLRLASFIIITLGGGLGWLPIFSTGADNTLAGFTSLYAYERGHEAMITFLLLSSFYLLFQYFKTEKKKYLYWLLATSSISISIHPPFGILLMLVGVIVGLWMYVRSQKYDLFIYPIFIALFSLVYYLFVLAKLIGNPGFSGVVTQDLFSVDSFTLLTGFGLLAVFIAWSIIFGQEKKEEFTYLKILFFSQLVLLLLPVGFHLYFAKNLYALGVLLGFYGIKELIQNKDRQIQVIIFLVAFSLIPRFYIFNQLLHVNVNNPFFFLKREEGDALEFMSKLPADAGVLSLYRIGNYIPAFSDTKVYYGHKFQTPNGPEKLRNAQIFYTKMTENEQKEFLKMHNINYIYYGLEETKLRKDSNLEGTNPFPSFPIVYQNDTAIIYAANQSALN